jgi:thiamine-phosphate pyrophosphorylase
MRKEFPKIQYITQDSEKYSHSEQAEIMFKNGIEWVQLRMKNASEYEVLSQAEKASFYANKHNKKLIINDSISIAKKVKAHGIHLGLFDTPVDIARKELGSDFIIGGTANTIEDIKLQISKGADYVGLGPYRFTKTKKNLSPVIGLEGYKKIYQQYTKMNLTTPIYAVGGITLDDIQPIYHTGIHGVAISSDLLNQIDNFLNQTIKIFSNAKISSGR